MANKTEVIYRRNPNFGQPDEPEMLPPETVRHEYSEVPLILSKTAFQDYAVGQLGGDSVGMARFTEIMDATRDSRDGAVRFAFSRYEAAQTFEKSNTASLTAIMVADSAIGRLTSDERAAILNNWPQS